jgi:hypothetical protein
MAAPLPPAAPQSFASPALAATQSEIKPDVKPETNPAATRAPAIGVVAGVATATAAAPALAKPEDSREDAATAAMPSPPVTGEGISQEQVSEIKAAIQAQQKFLGELLEQSTRWEADGSELRIYFPKDKQWCTEMIEGRESLEKVRGVSSKVLGRAVRVCAKLEAVAATAAAGAGKGAQELRAQFESNPMVRSMLQRFGGKLSEVRRRQEES